jgi:hypothetical protein
VSRFRTKAGMTTGSACVCLTGAMPGIRCAARADRADGGRPSKDRRALHPRGRGRLGFRQARSTARLSEPDGLQSAGAGNEPISGWQHVSLGSVARDAKIRASQHMRCNRVRCDHRKDHETLALRARRLRVLRCGRRGFWLSTCHHDANLRRSRLRTGSPAATRGRSACRLAGSVSP